MEKKYRITTSISASVWQVVAAWGPVLVWMVVIFSLSSRQRISVSSEYVFNFIFFKTLHVLEYSMLYLLSFRAVHLYGIASRKKVAIAAFFIVLLYATSDELHQTFVPSREGTVRDVIIDCAGAAVIWYFLYIQLPKAPKKLKTWGSSLGLFFESERARHR